MYNTSGSDIDMEEFEYHSGSRKVRKIKNNIYIFFFSLNFIFII
jgi:hypothetical protein